MIMQNIALLAAIVVPVVLLVLLRTNAAVVFLSLCAGALLVTFVGNEAGLVGSAVGNNSLVVSQYAQVALLLIPAILSAIILTKSMRGPKGIINIVPAVAVGLVGVLLAVPLLPDRPQHAISGVSGWALLDHNKQIVVIASVLVSLVILWFAKPSHHKRRHH
jgi:hypothetical protein